MVYNTRRLLNLKTHIDIYQGEIYKITALGQQIVFVCSVALLQEICDEKRFRKCVTGPVVEIRHSVHDALFTAYDNEPIWGIAHRIMAPLLTPAAVQKNFDGMRDSASKLVMKWSTSKSPVDITDNLRRLNVQAATLCLFGQDINCLDGAEPPVIAAMERATGEAVKRPTRPKLVNKLFYQRIFDKDTKTMRDFASSIIAKRATQVEAPENDMLHALLHAKDPETGMALTSEQVIDEIVCLLIGTVTAPNFIAFAVYYLLKNPSCITKAREEIDAVLGPGGVLHHQQLAKLPYFEAICRESLRLSAVAPGFNIEPIPDSTAPVSLAGGKYQVPANQCIIAVLAAVNRDPALFEDPEAFKPERMLSEAFQKLPLGARRWFGNGKRECIGKDFAWQWSFVTLVEIVRGVDLEFVDPNYALKMDGAFSLKPLGLLAKVNARV
jgi:cytochrome P450